LSVLQSLKTSTDLSESPRIFIMIPRRLILLPTAASTDVLFFPIKQSKRLFTTTSGGEPDSTPSQSNSPTPQGPQGAKSVSKAARLRTPRPPRPDFGIFFDIDGVIVRGKNVLPFAPHAFKRLVDDNGKFRVPAVFVTNACNTLRKHKADKLSSWLGIDVDEDQVVMSHSPLKMFRDYHDKHVLVIGQGPVDDIARALGFRKVTTIQQLRHAFPTLDNVDHKRRRAAPCAFEGYFPRIEAIVLFGEPIRWETSLQLLVDVLCTDGLPSRAPTQHNSSTSHLPVLACNMDLQFMAEAPMPRFGHGAFLLCLENLFKKVTGRDLVYTGLIGKPSEITYRHAEHVLQEQAALIAADAAAEDPDTCQNSLEPTAGRTAVSNIYCIGDNVCTDIFGANLYNRYLHHKRRERNQVAAARQQRAAGGGSAGLTAGEQLTLSRSIEHLIGGGKGDEASQELSDPGAENCYSVLVETGVYSTDSKHTATLDHSPRDFLPVQDSYSEPTFTVKNVYEAVDLIFKQENYQ